MSSEPKIKILSDNRKARHDYHLMDRFEAGIALAGTEVKSARAGKVQLRDGFAETTAWYREAGWLRGSARPAGAAA